jgi:hypothetical protein
MLCPVTCFQGNLYNEFVPDIYLIGFPFPFLHSYEVQQVRPEIPRANWNLVLHFQQQELVLLADDGPHLLYMHIPFLWTTVPTGTSGYAWLQFGVSRLNISAVHAGGLVKYLSRRATRQTLSAAQRL